ncbi:lipid II-degrading bacteriocin [Phyllobacterium endophyticum]|uniref:lipid II-degrading bacteriocin n=1 Tax=Phyllobacterium endophyticum TaxID=1149773 RepID=UPI0011C9B94C|nr:lipid II-degrading bacteriocin [Phyllobacterium endophyticum]
MTRHQDGTWNFQGEVRAWNDTYDFNSSDHRGMMQEVFTRTVNVLPGTSYYIAMPGSIPISWDGH